MEPSAPPSFEVCLDRLEKVVREMESSSLPLERALELFEEGMKLAEQCRQLLEAAENKVEILVRKADGTVTAQPFSIPEENTKP